MVFMLKFFNSVISFHFKDSAHNLPWTDRSLWYNFKLFLANYILIVGSHLQCADDPPWTAELSKNAQFAQDQAWRLQLSFFLFISPVVICNVFHCKKKTWKQFMKSAATKVMQCPLGVMYSHWLQFNNPSAWGYLWELRANCFSIHVCCCKQQAGIDRYLLLLPATRFSVTLVA